MKLNESFSIEISFKMRKWWVTWRCRALLKLKSKQRNVQANGFPLAVIRITWATKKTERKTKPSSMKLCRPVYSLLLTHVHSTLCVFAYYTLPNSVQYKANLPFLQHWSFTRLSRSSPNPSPFVKIFPKLFKWN